MSVNLSLRGPTRRSDRTIAEQIALAENRLRFFIRKEGNARAPHTRSAHRQQAEAETAKIVALRFSQARASQP